MVIAGGGGNLVHWISGGCFVEWGDDINRGCCRRRLTSVWAYNLDYSRNGATLTFAKHSSRKESSMTGTI